MEIIISETKQEMGKQAAQKGAELIRKAIAKRGAANIIVATGASQFEMLSELVKENINWSVVTGFHLDEYIGIDENHPASFRKYLKERFVSLVPLKDFHYVNGNSAEKECKRLGEIISRHPIDVAFVGIGENGHLAFNDPTFDDVPKQAISMSIKQIMKSKHIICSVPDGRKALAVKNSVKGKVSPLVPASVLQQHEAACLFLDQASASAL